MGTNYYRRHIITEEDINCLHKLIDERKFTSGYYSDEDNPYESAQSLINYLTGDGVHICKISCGWQVAFDHNWGKYYQPNRKSLEDFLNEPGTQIVDEYGDVLTSKEFWKIIDAHNANPRSRYTSSSYDEQMKKEYPYYTSYPCYEDRYKVKEKFNIDTKADDFTVDGLRFCVYTDFS